MFFLCTNYSNAQQGETSILIIPCKSGEILVDGVSKGKVEAEDVLKQQLSYGEHYLQLKTENEKFNLTTKIDANLKTNIIKLGCETSKPVGVKLTEKQITLSGAITGTSEDNVIALDDNDEIKILCEVVNKKGTANLSVVHVETGTELFRKNSFNLIDNEAVRIPKKGIYRIVLNTNAVFGREVKLRIERIPAPTSSPNFKTTVKIVSDTIPTEVLNTTVRVYSMTNMDHPNRTVVKLNLPANTTYWVYWIGVGQESKERMRQFASTLSSGASIFSSNPLFLFGMKLIPSLPMLNATSTINYRFMDVQNAQLFAGNYQHSYFPFKFGDKIATDYALVNQYHKDLSLCFWNESTWTGQDVEVRAIAFSVTRRYTLDE